ncbi:MAG: hypothetical protein H0Z28_13955, partial [Archaeoglobus sp.]|nr:hypothetical protein [Archaeoglobus sp.]
MPKRELVEFIYNLMELERAGIDAEVEVDALQYINSKIEELGITAKDFDRDKFGVGLWLLNKGLQVDGLKNFLLLSIDCFIEFREGVDGEWYARALLGEGNARVGLARLGIDAKENLERAVELCK